MKRAILSVLLGLAAIFAAIPSAHAQGSGHTGGGDTACERRIHEIRRDLLQWIDDRGPQRLDLRMIPGLTLDRYESGMRATLASGRTIVSCVSPTRFRPEPIQIDGEPKTCQWIEAADRAWRIRCNTDRFAKTLEADQYRLIHHEFAALAGLERGQGADSHYELSDQITSHLKKTVVLRLAAARPFRLEDIRVIDGPEKDYVSYAGKLFRMLVTGQEHQRSEDQAQSFVVPDTLLSWRNKSGLQALTQHLRSNQVESLTAVLQRYSRFLHVAEVHLFDSDTGVLLIRIWVDFYYISSHTGMVHQLSRVQLRDGPKIKSDSKR